MEIRLNELDSVVDKFVLAEATTTFQGEEKPLYFSDNKQRYSRFLHKIEHIVITDSPGFFYKFRVPRAWDRDNYQKEQVRNALIDCHPDDIILFSDLDEIPRATKIKEFKDKPGTKIFQQRFYSYFLNCATNKCPAEPAIVMKDSTAYWRGTVMARYEEINTIKEFRKRRSKQLDTNLQIEEGGWHFSYIGGLDSVMFKIRSLAHAKEPKYMLEHLTDPKAVEKIILSGNDLYGRDFKYKQVDIDETFPRHVLDNLNKFSHLIK